VARRLRGAPDAVPAELRDVLAFAVCLDPVLPEAEGFGRVAALLM